MKRTERLDDESLLTEKQAATFLTITPRTLWTLANEGLLPVVWVSRRCKRYRLGDLRAYLQKGGARDGITAQN